MSLEKLIPLIPEEFKECIEDAIVARDTLHRIEDVYGLFDKDLMDKLIELSGN
mgnify:CR=1 FL=1